MLECFPVAFDPRKFFDDHEKYAFDEDERSTLMDELLAKRAEAASAGEAAGLDHCTWTVRGGQWIATRTGMIYDSFRASAPTSEVRLWCEEHETPLTRPLKLLCHIRGNFPLEGGPGTLDLLLESESTAPS